MASTTVNYMPPPCNVIFNGRGYRFDGAVPPYSPYLKRKPLSLFIMFASVLATALAIHFRAEIGGPLQLTAFIVVLVSAGCIGWTWYKKSSDAVDVFASAPRNCSLTSSDSDVFYARK
jgi:hypothetical protein